MKKKARVFNQEPTFNKTMLANGVRIVTEHHPMNRAASSGIFVDLGTRDEPESLGGAAHFIEHLVFKGTKKRSAFEIAKSLEAVGGDLNAFTSREYTCFHATTLKQHLHLAIDVLGDLIRNALFAKEDFGKEREVILQEIDMSADTLEEYIFDVYSEVAFKNHSLGRSILGTSESLKGMSRKDLFNFYQRYYRGSNLVVSVAGDVDHQRVVEIVSEYLGEKKLLNTLPDRKKPRVRNFRKFIRKPSEQIHILMGHSSSAFRDDMRFEAYIINALLGGGMTSRLYQAVREDKGLVYSIYSYLHSFVDAGLLQIYAGASHKNAAQVIRLIMKEMRKLKSKGIKRSELEFYKTQVKGQILLGADDMENRMNSLGVNEMIFGRYRPVDEIIDEINSITVDSVQGYVDKFIKPENFGILLIGDIKDAQAESLLKLAEY